MWQGQHYSSPVTINITLTSVFRQILFTCRSFSWFLYHFQIDTRPCYNAVYCFKRYESNCWLDSGSRDRFFFAVFNLIFVFIRQSRGAAQSLSQTWHKLIICLPGDQGALVLLQLTTDKSQKDCVSHFVTHTWHRVMKRGDNGDVSVLLLRFFEAKYLKQDYIDVKIVRNESN